MEDYQILIDLAWSQNPDIFGIIRKYLQDHLDNRRPFLAEFQNKLHQRWDRRGTHHSETINDLHSFSKMNCMRRFLPVKISRNITRLHPSKFWMTPIDTIHPTQSHPTRADRARALRGSAAEKVLWLCADKVRYYAPRRDGPPRLLKGQDPAPPYPLGCGGSMMLFM